MNEKIETKMHIAYRCHWIAFLYSEILSIDEFQFLEYKLREESGKESGSQSIYNVYTPEITKKDILISALRLLMGRGIIKPILNNHQAKYVITDFGKYLASKYLELKPFTEEDIKNIINKKNFVGC